MKIKLDELNSEEILVIREALKRYQINGSPWDYGIPVATYESNMKVLAGVLEKLT